MLQRVQAQLLDALIAEGLARRAMSVHHRGKRTPSKRTHAPGLTLLSLLHRPLNLTSLTTTVHASQPWICQRLPYSARCTPASPTLRLSRRCSHSCVRSRRADLKLVCLGCRRKRIRTTTTGSMRASAWCLRETRNAREAQRMPGGKRVAFFRFSDARIVLCRRPVRGCDWY